MPPSRPAESLSFLAQTFRDLRYLSTAMSGPDEWLETVLKCKYLEESDIKELCEMVKVLLMEGKLKYNSEGAERVREENRRSSAPPATVA